MREHIDRGAGQGLMRQLGLWSVFRGFLAHALLTVSCLILATGVFAQSTTVDSNGDVGRHTSIAIGADGLGIISYYDATNQDLKVAHCSDVACTSATLTTLDSVGDVGQNTAIAIASDGLATISYRDATNQGLKVAHCSNQACTTASLSTLVSNAPFLFSPSAITIGADGLPLIAYTGSALVVAHCSDVLCSTATHSSTTLPGFGRPSIAIGSDGLALISIFGKKFHCSDLACTVGTSSDLSGGMGMVRYTSVVMAPGKTPRIVWSASSPSLFVSECADAVCTSDTRYSFYERRALNLSTTLGTDGQILVALEHENGTTPNPLRDLRVFHCTDDTCTTGTYSVVDPGVNGPQSFYPSIVTGTDGLGLISYYDQPNGNLKVAHCANTACATLAVGNVSTTVAQGEPGSSTISFPVTLSGAISQSVTVDYTTQDGTATAPADYTQSSGTLTFAPGETTQHIVIQIPPSAVARPDVTFTVELSNATAAFIADGTGLGTIRTKSPAFSISSPSVQRGASGTFLLRFLVALFPTTSQTATVRASTVSGGTASANVDFTPTSTVLNFAPGEGEKYLEVPVIGQPWGEPNETVNAKLTEATGAPVLTDSGVGTIISTVLPIPTISVLGASVVEGDAGLTPIVFTLSLSETSGEQVTVAFQTHDGTAIAGQDYVSASGTATFSPGARTQTIRVMVKANTAIQNDRTFSVSFGQASNAALSSSASVDGLIGRILDDDMVLSFTADSVLIPAGSASTLRWSAPEGATLRLDGQTVTGPVGSQQVNPSASKTYTLEATLFGVVDSRQVRITVTPANSPSGPSVTAPAAGSTVLVAGVTLSWIQISGSCGYDLRVFDSANGGTIFSGSLSGSSSTSTLVSLPDGAYLFAVRACLAQSGPNVTYGGWSSSPFSVQRITPAGRPMVTQPAPSAGLTQSTQTLAWTAVMGDPRQPDLFYEVLLEDVASGTTALQITVPHPTTSTIFTMGSSTEYRLRVRACQAGCGTWSDPVTFSMTLPAVPSTSPTGINCSMSGGNNLTCDWSAVTNADAYRVQVVQPSPAGPGGGALTVAARQLSGTQVSLPVPSGNATVFVAACNGDGCSSYASAPASINPVGPNPSTPNLGTPMAGTVVEGPGVFFTWNRVPGDSGTNTWYRLFVQDLSRQATALDVLTKDNFYSAYFKSEGARYDAVVVANPGLPSATSGPAQGFNVSGASSTAPTPVAPTHQGTFSAGNLQLSWTPVPRSALYEYFVAVTGQSGASARGVTPGLFVQVPLSGSGSGTRYTAIVRACALLATECAPGSDFGWGPWSNAPGGPGVTTFTVVP